MKTFLLTVSAAVALAVTVTMADGDQTQNLKLQQAIDLIETVGTPDEAAPLLEAAAEGPDPVVSARALLYLARVQERQNLDQARLTYGRIVADFASVGDVAAEAGRRLAATAPTPAAAVEETPTLVCEQCGDLYGSISPDGRFLATVNTTGMTRGEIGLRELSTQELTPLRIEGMRQPDGRMAGAALFPVFSPDSSQLAYTWVRGPQSPMELRVTSRRPGSEPRVVVSFDEAQVLYIEPVAWIGNDSLLTIVQRPDATWEVSTVSTTDGTLTQIRSLGWRLAQPLHEVAVSPDGRYVAYRAVVADPPTPLTPGRLAELELEEQIFVLAIDGSTETAVTTGAGRKSGPAWMPDGRHLLYRSDVSDGSWDLWAVPVAHGRRSGTPMLVHKDIGSVFTMGVDRAGRYYYHEARTGVWAFSVATITPGSKSGALVTDRIVGGLPTWSPDGRRIALTRTRPNGGRGSNVVVVELDGKTERVYEHPGGILDGPPRWFPDGSGLLVLADLGQDAAFFKIDLESGAFHRLVDPLGDPEVSSIVGGHALAPDGRTVYMGAFRSDSERVLDRIVALDLESGRYRDVFRLPGADDGLPNGIQTLVFAISPDGRSLAVNWEDRAEASRGKLSVHLATVGVDGQGYRELVAPYSARYLRWKLDWSPDGEWIYFSAGVSDDGTAIVLRDNDTRRVMRVRSTGGTPEPVGVEALALDSFDVSPDGRQIAFYTLRAEGAGNLIWALDVNAALQATR